VLGFIEGALGRIDVCGEVLFPVGTVSVMDG
jgi:hypothetical protein